MIYLQSFPPPGRQAKDDINQNNLCRSIWHSYEIHMRKRKCIKDRKSKHEGDKTDNTPSFDFDSGAGVDKRTCILKITSIYKRKGDTERLGQNTKWSVLGVRKNVNKRRYFFLLPNVFLEADALPRFCCLDVFIAFLGTLSVDFYLFFVVVAYICLRFWDFGEKNQFFKCFPSVISMSFLVTSSLSLQYFDF